jgi:alkanesulfonate monooxygenase SsuD/methylene tetrahydromethanopterin reductase-like flavin-dependent oxidoreductase (luciferase family)
MIEGQEGVSWEQWRDIAGACESLGFDGLFRSDHHLSMFAPEARTSMDAWTTLAALAACTERIRLGTLVSPVTFRHPAHLANVVATADVVSGGRVELGLGAGWYRAEHDANGLPFPTSAERFDMLAAQLEVLHSHWRGVNHGAGHPATGTPRPVQRPHPPILMGGQAGPRASELAARWANGYNLYETAPEQIAAKRDRLHAACERLGRAPESLELSVNANVLIGSDREDLERRAVAHMAYQSTTGDPAAYLDGLGPDRLVGSPGQVAERIGAYAREGVTRMMLQLYPHHDREAIAMIGDVIAAVR